MSARRLSTLVIMAVCVTAGLASAGPTVASELPDNRVYEIVTPPDGFGSEVYQPVDESLQRTMEFSSAWTQYPFQSSADGNSVAFVAGPTVDGSESSGFHAGNEYLARRSETGQWTISNVSPAGVGSAVFQGFSPDLSVGVLDATQPLAATAPGFGEVPSEGQALNYDVFYSTRLDSGDGYEPLFTIKPPYRRTTAFATAGAALRPELNSTFRLIRGLSLVGASSDFSHLLFMANDALTGAEEGRPAAEGGASSTYEEADNLYESINGRARLVNVLSDGSTHVGATFGGLSRFSHDISSDGSKVFWTDLTTGRIYVRENGVNTVEISPSGRYQSASSDGSVVLYTDGDLYRYELASGRTVDMTPGVPVEEVIGTSEDASYVYYVTSEGEFDLWHEGAISTISPTSPGRAEVTPDGRHVVYIDFQGEIKNGPIKVYNADTGTVQCASCASGGKNGLLPTTNQDNVFQTRWIAADGSKVFFESMEVLVPQDINDKLDVYEWERPGSGTCANAEGCIYLLSGGTSGDESYLAEMDESGDSAFIVTRAKLLGSDDNELYDLYDVRENGHVAIAPPACSGTGCQGVPGAPPIFATPSSVTFEGVGNFATPKPESRAKAKPKPAKHKAKSKKAKRKRRHKVKRKAKKSARGRGSRTRGR
jgi:hypothetical protein